MSCHTVQRPETPGHKRSRSAILKSLMPSSRSTSPIKASPSKVSPTKIGSTVQSIDAGSSLRQQQGYAQSMLLPFDHPHSAQPILGERNQNKPIPLTSPLKTGSRGSRPQARPMIGTRGSSSPQKVASNRDGVVWNKENTTPPATATSDTPIWAQFASQATEATLISSPTRYILHESSSSRCQNADKDSFKADSSTTSSRGTTDRGKSWDDGSDRPSSKSSATSYASKRDSKVLAAIAKFNGQSEHVTKPTTWVQEELDAAFETVLQRRNIPEKMRETMRLLDPVVKAEFIRHGSPEKQGNPQSDEPLPQKSSMWNTLTRGRAKSFADKQRPNQEPASSTKRGRSRGRSGASNTPSASPSKRARSSSRPRSLFSLKNLSSTSLHLIGLDGASDSKEEPASPKAGNPVDSLRRPVDFINYIRDSPKPEEVEVGKLHKLRLLLRNESVSWVDTFIIQDGMKEILNLLDRVRSMTWREEHEDLVLHEVLLCLKALCTTQRALDKLAEASPTLFPNLLRMLFDEDKKGPAEFNTRGVVVNLLFSYVSVAPVEEYSSRAKKLLSYLADPLPSDEEKPIGFLLEMQQRQHQARPYLQWCKEFSNVTKEVFWIFMHHYNVIVLPEPVETPAETYRERHFPKSRVPEALNPWVGGVEWEATSYLATHVELINGLIASLGTQTERNQVRRQLRDSGFEKVMGSLRLCKEKFYPAPHDAARDWVAAAIEDGWDVDDVRLGPPKDDHGGSPSKSSSRKENEAPPKLELPKLDLGDI